MTAPQRTHMTISPKITADVVLRFADGAETVVGQITYSPDVEVSLVAPGRFNYELKRWEDAQ